MPPPPYYLLFRFRFVDLICKHRCFCVIQGFIAFILRLFLFRLWVGAKNHKALLLSLLDNTPIGGVSRTASYLMALRVCMPGPGLWLEDMEERSMAFPAP